MKLYIPHLSIYNNHPRQFTIQPFANYKETNLYSSNGMFQIVHDNKTNNTNIRKVHIVDKPKEEITLPMNQFTKLKHITGDKNQGLLDKSEKTLGETYFQLPMDYVKEVSTIIKFHLREKALVELVFVMDEHVVKDIYFELKESIHSYSIMEDVVSFLSQLN